MASADVAVTELDLQVVVGPARAVADTSTAPNPDPLDHQRRRNQRQ
jgi:hypothetical protein